jgi:hypothetical protein
MAQAGEVEVFRITPQVDKCYEHIEATRSVYIGGGKYTYFSKNEPKYVGKFIIQKSHGDRNGAKYYDYFDDNGKENVVQYSYEGLTCFTEVKCKTGGGMRKSGIRKRSRRARRKLKTRKNRK